ncbi:polysaccharide deacetylase family protein [Aliarcobacter butzleri]|uniref:polysaccharide deacetylase family protein n=1 Tax=Aliarcobacter butzleri TaxID=28197 RepID=UPI001EDB860D|nr:polysaccharide deacetylase family protein [Aliarcobacter butzleri]MCG3701759.1 polysaccharide deacetylase family protein [Aliarcobacter butzleri]MCG3703956.1 polysaccharide deacetylase family protein [Aliarcobacter butzleri]
MSLKKVIKNTIGEIYYNGYYKYIKPNGNRILIYHAFGSKLKHDSYGISINPKLFEEHLKFLKDNYKLLPLNHNTLDNKLDIDSITITIDDGYKDNLVAVELMEKYQIPYTIYISTGLISKEQYLTTQDLEDISKLCLCTLGTHSVNHVHLSRLNKNEQYKELYDSKLFLENIIGKKVIDFSYPYGDYNDSSKNIADELYEIIATSHIGINTINCDKKMLKRIEIIASDNVQSLRKKIDGYYDFL